MNELGESRLSARRNWTITRVLLVSAVLASACGMPAALAQTTATAGAAAASADNATLAEVVVTARKRCEDLQKRRLPKLWSRASKSMKTISRASRTFAISCPISMSLPRRPEGTTSQFGG